MDIKIEFLEYIIMSVLISILYLFTAMELLIKKNKDDRKNVEEYQFSAQWALLGIVLTVVCGYIVKWNIFGTAIDYRLLLVVPLFFIGQWLYFYINSSIVANGFADIRGQVLELYRPVLIEVLTEIRDGRGSVPHVPFIDDEGYASGDALVYLVELKLKQAGRSRTFENLVAPLLDKVGKAGRRNIRNKGLDIVFDMVRFDRDKLDILLSRLRGKGEVEVKPHIDFHFLYKIVSPS